MWTPVKFKFDFIFWVEFLHTQCTLVLIATTTTEVHKTIGFNEQINKGPAPALKSLVHLFIVLGKTKT